MLLDLKFSIGTLGIGTGALVAGFYGMNLKNFIEESDLGFFGISCSTFVCAAIVWVIGLHKLRRVQQVSMWGEQDRAGGRGNWKQVEPGVVGQGTREFQGTRAVQVWNGREVGGALGADGRRNSDLVPPDLPLPVAAAMPSAAFAGWKSKQKRPSWRKYG